MLKVTETCLQRVAYSILLTLSAMYSIYCPNRSENYIKNLDY